MKRKVLLVFTILLLFSLQMNMFDTYSYQNLNEEKLVINAYDYSNWYWTGTEIISDMSSSISESPTIITDNEKNIHAVWSDSENYEGSGTDYDIFYRKWSSSSKSWSPTELVTTTSTGNSNNPKIGVDSENNIHLVWDDFTDLEGSGTDRDVFYQKR
ncbi:MAG: hypothetical protein KGD64_13700, partial [Candidatus Heimdallarchaeota archaeon]|nr:hypothetical protein [Candidatus Heimdallarchaeota archaeon]